MGPVRCTHGDHKVVPMASRYPSCSGSYTTVLITIPITILITESDPKAYTALRGKAFQDLVRPHKAQGLGPSDAPRTDPRADPGPDPGPRARTDPRADPGPRGPIQGPSRRWRPLAAAGSLRSAKATLCNFCIDKACKAL